MSVVSILAPLLIVLCIVVVPVLVMALATLSARRETDELETLPIPRESDSEVAWREGWESSYAPTRPPDASWDRYCARGYRRVRSSSHESPFESAPSRVWEI